MEAKRSGLRIGILTNNWEGTGVSKLLGDANVDVLVESYKEKLRKPDLRVFALCQERLRALDPSIVPGNVVFLDDLGMNCKAAKQFGWNVVRVERGKEGEAIEKLRGIVGKPASKL